jgi:hypothetical protein
MEPIPNTITVAIIYIQRARSIGMIGVIGAMAIGNMIVVVGSLGRSERQTGCILEEVGIDSRFVLLG